MDEKIKEAMDKEWTDGSGYRGIEKAYELTKAYAGSANANPTQIPLLFLYLADIFVLKNDTRK